MQDPLTHRGRVAAPAAAGDWPRGPRRLSVGARPLSDCSGVRPQRVGGVTSFVGFGPASARTRGSSLTRSTVPLYRSSRPIFC